MKVFPPMTPDERSLTEEAELKAAPPLPLLASICYRAPFRLRFSPWKIENCAAVTARQERQAPNNEPLIPCARSRSSQDYMYLTKQTPSADPAGLFMGNYSSYRGRCIAVTFYLGLG